MLRSIHHFKPPASRRSLTTNVLRLGQPRAECFVVNSHDRRPACPEYGRSNTRTTIASWSGASLKSKRVLAVSRQAGRLSYRAFPYFAGFTGRSVSRLRIPSGVCTTLPSPMA